MKVDMFIICIFSCIFGLALDAAVLHDLVPTKDSLRLYSISS